MLGRLSLRVLIFNFLGLRRFISQKERSNCLQTFFAEELPVFQNLLLEMKILLRHRILHSPLASLDDLKTQLARSRAQLVAAQQQLRALLRRPPRDDSRDEAFAGRLRKIPSSLFSFARSRLQANDFFDQSLEQALQNAVHALYHAHCTVAPLDGRGPDELTRLKRLFLERLVAQRTAEILKILSEELRPLRTMDVKFAGKVYGVWFTKSRHIDIYYKFLFLSKLQQSAESSKGTVKLDLGFSGRFLFLAKIMRDNNFAVKQEKVQGVLQIVEYMLLLIPYSLNIQLLFLDYRIFEYHTVINFYMILFVVAFLLQLGFFLSHHSYNAKLSALLGRKTRVFPIHTVSLLLFKCFTQQVLFTLGLQFQKPYLFNLMLTIEWFVVFAPLFRRIRRVTLDFMVPAFLLLVLVIQIKLIFSKVLFVFSPASAGVSSAALATPSLGDFLRTSLQWIYANFLDKVGFDIQSDSFRAQSRVLSADLRLVPGARFQSFASTYSFLKDGIFNLLIFLSSKTFFVITLSTLREFRKTAARRQSQIRNRCLICGKTKAFLEGVGENFNDHIHKKHSVKRFLSLMFLIRFQDARFLDFLSFRLKNLLQENNA
ncbi:MAG: hypothetical protein AAF368_03430, partial [Planctomycetota bacterium]